MGESCKGQEAVTDAEGNFKILGLTQNCLYNIRIKTNGDYVISPDNQEVQIQQADVQNIEFTAFKGTDLIKNLEHLFPKKKFRFFSGNCLVSSESGVPIRSSKISKIRRAYAVESV